MTSLATRLAISVFGLGAPALATPLQLRPAADGRCGAWLVAAPVVDDAPVTEAMSPRLGAVVRGAAYRFEFSRDGVLDLTKRVQRGQSAWLGMELVLPAPAAVWLLVQSSGSGEVFLDGKGQGQVRPSGRGAAFQPVPMLLERGTRKLVLRVTRGDGSLRVGARLLARADLRVPKELRWQPPGVDADALGARFLSQRLESGVSPKGFFPRLVIEAPAGAPASPLDVWVQSSEGRVALGRFAASSPGVTAFEAFLPPPAASTPRMQVSVHVGDMETRVAATLPAEAPALLGRAAAQQRRLAGADHAKFLDAQLLSVSLEQRAAALRLAASDRASATALVELRNLVQAVEANRDPLTTPGVIDLARPAAVARGVDAMRLHVPASTAGTKLPLVVLLHGLGGNPKGVMDAFLDDTSLAPKVPGFVLAPYAHGNAFYRGPGEREALAAIDWALRTLPVDPARVAISGVSMGGTGTAHLALRYPEQFSAAAPLCGYHSYFVRRDTANRPLSEWERSRMRHWSPAEWAENGVLMPWWVAHGTRDFPLENSKVLIEALTRAGASLTQEWPDTGHAVWEKTYAGARLFPWLTRPASRKEPLVIVTDSYRYATRRHAAITRLGRPGRMARLSVQRVQDRLEVQTSDLEGFSLDADHWPNLTTLRIDGVDQPRGTGALQFKRGDGGGFRRGLSQPAPGEKQRGAEGPIRDVFNEAVVVSFGTERAELRIAAREIAQAWAERFGASADLPVQPDFELRDDAIRDQNLILVGTPSSHSWLRRFSSRLPLAVDDQSISVAQSRFRAKGLGAVFMMQSPLRQDRTWVVITAPDAAGLYLSRSLPALLPDFIVYDERVADAAGEQVLGTTPVLAAGFYDHAFKPQSLATGPRKEDGGS